MKFWRWEAIVWEEYWHLKQTLQPLTVFVFLPCQCHPSSPAALGLLLPCGRWADFLGFLSFLLPTSQTSVPGGCVQTYQRRTQMHSYPQWWTRENRAGSQKPKPCFQQALGWRRTSSTTRPCSQLPHQASSYTNQLGPRQPPRVIPKLPHVLSVKNPPVQLGQKNPPCRCHWCLARCSPPLGQKCWKRKGKPR